MSTTFARKCIAAAFCVAALAVQPSAFSAEASAAAAAAGREPVPFTFRFDSDDLDSANGAKQVYQDLKRKAERACTTEAVSGSHIQRVDRDCAADLMAAVVRRISSRTLTAQLDYRR